MLNLILSVVLLIATVVFAIRTQIKRGENTVSDMHVAFHWSVIWGILIAFEIILIGHIVQDL